MPTSLPGSRHRSTPICPPATDADLRRFEWYYWQRRSHGALRSLGLPEGIPPPWSSVPTARGWRRPGPTGGYRSGTWPVVPGASSGSHTGVAFAVAFSPDGARLASVGADGKVKLWDTATGSALRSLSGQEGVVFGVAFSPDGARLATADGDGPVRVWGMDSDRPLHVLRRGGVRARAVAFSPDGARIVSGDVDGIARIWNAADGTLVRELGSPHEAVTAVAYSADGRWIGTAGGHTGIRLWDAESGALALTLKAGTGSLLWLAFSPDGSRVAAGGSDKTIWVWDLPAGTLRLTLGGHHLQVWGLAFSPDGRLLASAGGDGIKVWDAVNDRQCLVIPAHTGRILALAYSPDGSRLATVARGDDSIRVWESTTGRLERTIHLAKSLAHGAGLQPRRRPHPRGRQSGSGGDLGRPQWASSWHISPSIASTNHPGLATEPRRSAGRGGRHRRVGLGPRRRQRP